eukprot:1541119-Rhodomonas_salina.1
MAEASYCEWLRERERRREEREEEARGGVCVCVCVCERERERERGCVWEREEEEREREGGGRGVQGHDGGPISCRHTPLGPCAAPVLTLHALARTPSSQRSLLLLTYHCYHSSLTLCTHPELSALTPSFEHSLITLSTNPRALSTHRSLLARTPHS